MYLKWALHNIKLNGKIHASLKCTQNGTTQQINTNVSHENGAMEERKRNLCILGPLLPLSPVFLTICPYFNFARNSTNYVAGSETGRYFYQGNGKQDVSPSPIRQTFQLSKLLYLGRSHSILITTVVNGTPSSGLKNQLRQQTCQCPVIVPLNTAQQLDSYLSGYDK